MHVSEGRSAAVQRVAPKYAWPRVGDVVVPKISPRKEAVTLAFALSPLLLPQERL